MTYVSYQKLEMEKNQQIETILQNSLLLRIFHNQNAYYIEISLKL